MPLPTARNAVPMAAVVLPLPAPVLTMMRPLRTSSAIVSGFEFRARNLRTRKVATASVSRVVRVAFQDCKCAVELFQQNHACEFVGKRDLAEGEHLVGRLAGFLRKSVGRADPEQDILSTAVLLVAQELRKLLRAELPSALVEKNESRAGATGGFFRQFHQSGFVAHFVRFGLCVAGEPFQIFGSKRLDCWLVSFPNPRNAELHRRHLP